jgi:uncharacterized RDD family membrane protein YckC
MKHSIRLFSCLVLLCSLVYGALTLAQDDTPTTAATPAAPEATADAAAEPAIEAEDSDDEENSRRRDSNRERRRVVIAMDRDAHLDKSDWADAFITLFGSATVDGEVKEGVVAVFGNARVTGRVGESVAAIFGDVYVDSEIHDAVVSVFGNVELGPNAVVHGDIVAVGGRVIRDRESVSRGDIEEISVPTWLDPGESLGAWIKHCLLLGRPLAIAPNLEWAWGLALGFLAFYVLLALLFTRSVDACVETIETQPGQTVLASILAVLLTPILFALLAITVVGLGLVPFLVFGLLFAGLFGKAVVLGALGRRVTRFVQGGPFSHVAFAVLLGGLIVLGLYLVPVLGFVAFNAIGVLGLGVVVYTLLLAVRARQESNAAAPLEPQLTTAVATATAAGGFASEPAPERPSAASAASMPNLLPRADFWIRMGALFIDIVLIGIVLSVLHADGDLTPAVLAAYGAVLWKLKGTTVGGIVCNLQVVRVDGRALDWSTCIVRALSCFLSLAVLGLGFLWILFDDQRQAWHDKIAGTIVVRVPKGVSLV